MEFKRSIGRHFTSAIQKEGTKSTLDIEIKQKDVSATDLNAVIRKFTEEVGIGELDSNSIQLVTEEIVVMVLLPKISINASMQFDISYDPPQGTIQMVMQYPGAKYNPFEVEDDIFMINIFREWITEIDFKNPDNRFNKLVLTIQGEKKEEDLLLDQLISRETEEPQVSGSTSVSPGVFNFEGQDPAKENIAHNIRQSNAHTLEILIRDVGVDAKRWYEYMNQFFKNLEFDKRSVAFDAIPTTAEGAVKSVSRVLIYDVLAHSVKNFSYIAFKISYIEEDEEAVIRLRYPGDEYNPYVNNAEDRGIKVISRQVMLTPFYTYKKDMNELLIYVNLLK